MTCSWMTVFVCKHKRNLAFATLLSSSLVLVGCQDGQLDRRDISTAAGGLLGAVSGGYLGKAVAGRGATVVAAVAGTAAGAWIGNQFGSYLDERDRQELSRSTQATSVTGTPRAWRNPETGATVATRVTGTRTTQQTLPVPVLKDRIAQIPPLELIGAPYRTKRSATVRGGPGTDYAASESLTAGQTVEVIGKVQARDWYMVGQGGAGSGFVATALLEPLPPGMAKPPAPSPEPAGTVETVEVATTRTCRTIEQTVTTPEGPKSDRVTACQGPNGWEVS